MINSERGQAALTLIKNEPTSGSRTSATRPLSATAPRVSGGKQDGSLTKRGGPHHQQLSRSWWRRKAASTSRLRPPATCALANLADVDGLAITPSAEAQAMIDQHQCRRTVPMVLWGVAIDGNPSTHVLLFSNVLLHLKFQI
jgi:hypothetical protein